MATSTSMWHDCIAGRAFCKNFGPYLFDFYVDAHGELEAATRDSLSFYRMQMSVSIDRLAKAWELTSF